MILVAAPGSGGAGWLWALLGAALLVVGVVIAVVLAARRQRRTDARYAQRAEVQTLLDRLSADILTLDAKDDPVTVQALADAAERHASAGAVTAQSGAPEQLAVARRTALEGLYAARVARQRLGLDPGPELPPVGAGNAGQLDTSRLVRIRDRTYQGHPSYTPGSPYYYGGGTLGGAFVPAGWYGMPFWEPFLLGAVLADSWSGADGGADGGGSDGGSGGGGGGLH